MNFPRKISDDDLRILIEKGFGPAQIFQIAKQIYEEEQKMEKRELEWIDGDYRMKLEVTKNTNGFTTYIYRWDEEEQKWEERDGRDDWTGTMAVDGFGFVVGFLELGKKVV